ncbi:MAG: biotin/lipoyl-binding protein, partial [Lysobacterales bacterium]
MKTVMTTEYKRAFAGVAAVLVSAGSIGASAGNDSVFDCVIQPTEYVELSSSVPGIIDTIAVDRSDPVEKGQVVAKLQSDVEQAQVELSKQRAAFDSEIESKRAGLGFAQRNQERTQQLFTKKAVPFGVLDQAKTDAIRAAAELRIA